MLRRLGGAILCLGMLFIDAPSMASPPAVVDAPASASATAVRLNPPTPRPVRGCQRVMVIGDSLTVGSRTYLTTALNARGVVNFVDGMNGRRIPATAGLSSGVTTAIRMRASVGEAECWVIALGTNDLGMGAGSADTARRLIDEMLAAVTPGAWVWWVNVNYRAVIGSSFDFVGATSRFNQTLAQRAAQMSQLRVIDWYSMSNANSWWFVDHVHVNASGSAARAGQILQALGYA